MTSYDLAGALDKRNRIRVIHLMQQSVVPRDIHPPLPCGRHEHLCDTSQWVASRWVVLVSVTTQHEHKVGDDQCARWDPKPPIPSNVGLHVDQSTARHQGTRTQAQIINTEEHSLVLLLHRVELVKLVSTQGGQAWLEPAGAECNGVNGHVEHPMLSGWWPGAINGSQSHLTCWWF